MTLYNYPLHDIKSGPDLDVLFPVGQILLIREPVYKRAGLSISIRSTSH